MTYEQALAALAGRTNYEATGKLVAPTLDRIRALLDLLAHPERSAPAVHVTGTNGKTTCARAVTEVLRATGLGVGTYTSPHLRSPRERIAFDGEPLSEEAFAATYEYLDPFLREMDGGGSAPTWFEALTAMAFVHFADVAAGALVLEVGMGGRWDATNVVDAPVAVITSIGLDHPELGPTLADKAREKAGIVASGAVALTAPQAPEVIAVLEGACAERGATLRRMGVDFAVERRERGVGGYALDLRIGNRRYEDVFVPLLGARLADDAALALAAAVAFLGDADLDDDLVGQAMGAVTSPGRMEVASRRPLVVLDGAHNPAAAAALAEAMRESFRWERLIVVAGMLADKDVEGVLGAIAPIASMFLLAAPESARAAPPERLRDAILSFGGTVETIAPNVPEALAAAIDRAAEGDVILVTGSLYTVAEARSRLVKENA